MVLVERFNRRLSTSYSSFMSRTPSNTGMRVQRKGKHSNANVTFRDQIRENVLSKQYYCDVDIADLIAYDEQLAHQLNNEPGEIIPLV